MKKHDLKNYNRLLKAENEAQREILQMAENILDGGYQCNEIKLLQEENNEIIDELSDLHADWAESKVVAGTAMWGMVQEINDLRADMAVDHTEYRKTLETIKEQNTRECDLNVRLQGKIANLEEDLATANRRIKDLQDALGATPL